MNVQALALEVVVVQEMVEETEIEIEMGTEIVDEMDMALVYVSQVLWTWKWWMIMKYWIMVIYLLLVVVLFVVIVAWLLVILLLIYQRVLLLLDLRQNVEELHV